MEECAISSSVVLPAISYELIFYIHSFRGARFLQPIFCDTAHLQCTVQSAHMQRIGFMFIQFPLQLMIRFPSSHSQIEIEGESDINFPPFAFADIDEE